MPWWSPCAAGLDVHPRSPACVRKRRASRACLAHAPSARPRLRLSPGTTRLQARAPSRRGHRGSSQSRHHPSWLARPAPRCLARSRLSAAHEWEIIRAKKNMVLRLHDCLHEFPQTHLAAVVPAHSRVLLPSLAFARPALRSTAGLQTSVRSMAAQKVRGAAAAEGNAAGAHLGVRGAYAPFHPLCLSPLVRLTKSLWRDIR